MFLESFDVPIDFPFGHLSAVEVPFFPLFLEEILKGSFAESLAH